MKVKFKVGNVSIELTAIEDGYDELEANEPKGLSPRTTFGEKLKRLRLSRGKTQLETAQDMADKGYSFTQVRLSQLEHSANLPKRKVVFDLANYYGVKPEFFEGE